MVRLVAVMLMPIAVSAIVVGVGHTVAMSVAVPLGYAAVTKVLDFLAKWEIKGRRSRGKYRIWFHRPSAKPRDDENPEWQMETGGVKTLVTRYGDGSTIGSIEQSVRFKDGNPCSLGLDLVAGAIAIDVVSAITGQGGPPYLGYAFGLHAVLLVAVGWLVWMNHIAPPHEFWWLKISAVFPIAFGGVAMGTSILALDPEIVSALLGL